ncbi:type VII secretion protein EccB [Corynebacterium sp. ES2794-CONJ1]|uniref:type VII secretion protein EccB n=1 Tax=Corynebacterium sp. ES2794-CONJ1 TaxID=2980553 RepID=UPI0021DB5A90|nr:type VII secretion protein EccB [Corynebacterium sp. ES2794-CONJ1]MCU9518889.1 type VII secretion protein EccB [Corynebacterium sp. ES2794-CONJ1]
MAVTPTTKAQVTGHKFLWRRVEHALILGDERMLHDPLGRRRRSVLFGLAATVLIAICSVALAFFRPAIDPGQAELIRADSGQLYMRMEDHLHPVANLTSARLILQEAVEPVSSSDQSLFGLAKTTPIGIVDAPALFAPQQGSQPTFDAIACHEIQPPHQRLDKGRDMLVVMLSPSERVSATLRPIVDRETFLARTSSGDFLISEQGRLPLLPDTSPEGRMMRRALGIENATPLWFAADAMIDAIDEVPPFRDFDINTVLGTGFDYWGEKDGTIIRLSPTQAELIMAKGIEYRQIPNSELRNYTDRVGYYIPLPPTRPILIDPAEFMPCINSTGQLLIPRQRDPDMMLSPSFGSRVDRPSQGSTLSYIGPGYALAVDTGSGVHIISETGKRHGLRYPEMIKELGIDSTTPMSWELLSLLPEGTPLSQEAALSEVIPQQSP